MGRNKALIRLNDTELINYSIQSLEPLCNNIIISGDPDIYAQFGLRVIMDIHRGIGPLAGFEAVYTCSKADWFLITACDTPFVSSQIFDQIFRKAHLNNKSCIVVGRDGKVEPLVGCYAPNILPAIQKQIKKGDYKLQNFLKEIPLCVFEVTDSSILHNMNTPTDLSANEPE